MVDRIAFLGEELNEETRIIIIESIKDRWELEKGSGWTDEYYIDIGSFDPDNIDIGSFDPDNIEIDCHTETHIDVFEDELRKILDKIDVSYVINQY